MTDERLEEIREATANQRRFMERPLVSHLLTEGHAVRMMEDMIAEVERLRADAARWDWAQANLSSLTWEDNGYSAREYVDYLAGEEATWLPK